MGSRFGSWARFVVLELLRAYVDLWGPLLCGRVRLMKMCFLSVYKRIGRVVVRFAPERSDFAVWHHGPYSPTVDGIVSDLIDRGVIVSRDVGLGNPLYVVDRGKLVLELSAAMSELSRSYALLPRVRSFVLGRVSAVAHLYGSSSVRRLESRSLKVIGLSEVSKERYKGMNVEDVIERRGLKLVPIDELIS